MTDQRAWLCSAIGRRMCSDDCALRHSLFERTCWHKVRGTAASEAPAGWRGTSIPCSTCTCLICSTDRWATANSAIECTGAHALFDAHSRRWRVSCVAVCLCSALLLHCMLMHQGLPLCTCAACACQLAFLAPVELTGLASLHFCSSCMSRIAYSQVQKVWRGTAH